MISTDPLKQKESYLVFVKYEDWHLEGECDLISDAVALREQTLRSSGGAEVLLVKYMTIFDAYRMAEYEARDRARKQKETAQ